jgi:hypothetical protein
LGDRGQPSRGLSIVALEDSAELLLAANRAMALWLEHLVEHAIMVPVITATCLLRWGGLRRIFQVALDANS